MKTQLIDCISKLYVNKRLQDMQNKEAILKSLLLKSFSPDKFEKEYFKEVQPMIVKIKNNETSSVQNLLKKYRLKQINKIK